MNRRMLTLCAVVFGLAFAVAAYAESCEEARAACEAACPPGVVGDIGSQMRHMACLMNCAAAYYECIN